MVTLAPPRAFFRELLRLAVARAFFRELLRLAIARAFRERMNRLMRAPPFWAGRFVRGTRRCVEVGTR